MVQLSSGAPGVVLQPPYSFEDLSSETGLSQKELTSWLRAIERKGQAILYGPPGTGKTYVAKRLAKYLVSESDGFVDLVQFHPAYTYEDFIQGIRPQSTEEGNLSYSMKPGHFLTFCKKAEQRTGICVLIIDEINRANLARVFGELMYALEYRDEEIVLSSGESFRIPKNVRIIGTMNTADRSIALVDHALRRRFAFLNLRPNYEVLKQFQQQRGFPTDKLIRVLKTINQSIADPNFEIGISFFMVEDLKEELEEIWKMEIEPYLEEYFFDQPDVMSNYRWDQIKGKVYA
jgi:5-methylcytosine-specific restriction protein B